MENYNNTNDNYALVNWVTTYFLYNIAKCDLTLYFNLSISTNIADDCIKYDKTLKPNPNNEYAGLVILPCDPKGKIQVLISENSCDPQTILHELTHMYDFVLFSIYFCNENLHKVKQHEYYQTLVDWSEFHAKLIDIPYSYLLLDIAHNVPEDKYFSYLSNQIQTYLYQYCTKKFINKQNVDIKDILWYLGELAVCNLYDKNNTYNIPENIIHDYGQWILQLYTLFFQCQSFDDFANNVEAFRTLLQ